MTTTETTLPDLYWPWKGKNLTGYLANAVTLKRGHGSLTEAAYVAQLCSLLPVTCIDEHGNIHIDTRTAPEHRTLLTAHTDTVHRTGGKNAVKVDRESEPGQEFWRAHGAALGADDGAGIALVCHLIDHGFKGYAVLFRGEEVGGIGSKGLAESQPELLQEFDRAIAFDRAGYYDVITHQSGDRCASDEFAQALADQINLAGDFMFCPDAGGVYTDTAEFTHLIAECTNLSVGYFRQHGDGEYQNVTFLQKLAEALLTVNWDSLPVVRKAELEFDDPWSLYKHDLEADLCEALEQALAGYYLGINRMLSQTGAEAYGLTAEEACGFMRFDKLTKVLLSTALEDLVTGAAAEDIMLDMYDEITR